MVRITPYTHTPVKNGVLISSIALVWLISPARIQSRTQDFNLKIFISCKNPTHHSNTAYIILKKIL